MAKSGFGTLVGLHSCCCVLKRKMAVCRTFLTIAHNGFISLASFWKTDEILYIDILFFVFFLMCSNGVAHCEHFRVLSITVVTLFMQTAGGEKGRRKKEGRGGGGLRMGGGEGGGG